MQRTLFNIRIAISKTSYDKIVVRNSSICYIFNYTVYKYMIGQESYIYIKEENYAKSSIE